MIGNIKTIAIVELEKHVVNVGIFHNIMNKFCYLEISSLIIWLIIDKASKISIFYTILPIILTISLRVKNNKDLLFNFQEIA